MPTPVVYQGITYFIPSFGDGGYAQGAGNLSLYLIALASGSLTTSGGIFTLTNDVNFGSSFGLIAKYFTSVTANPASAGTVRLANTDNIEWRNFANSGNDVLAVNSSDQLIYQGVPIAGSGAGVTSIIGTVDEIIASSPTGVVTLSTPQPIASTSTPTFAGETLTGPLAMGSNKITGLATGTASTDAANVGQTVTNPLVTNLAAGGNKITGLASGTVSGDALSFNQSGAALAGLTLNANKLTNIANGTAATDAVAFDQLTTGNAITAGGIANATITGTQIASSIALAGSPTTTTPASGDSSTKIATTANLQIDHVAVASASNNASISFTGLSGANYSYFEVIIDALTPGTDAVSFHMQVSTGSGFLTTNYTYENIAWAGTTSTVTSATGQSSFDVMDGAGTGGGVTQSLKITIFGPDSSLPIKRSTWQTTGFYQSGLFFTTMGGGVIDTNSSPIDGIKFFMSSGNIATGQFTVYGYRA